jgi:hypothetical protein
LVNDEENAVSAKPARRLTDTAPGQALFIALWMVGTIATIAALIGAFFLGRLVSSEDTPPAQETLESVEEAVDIVSLAGGARPAGEWSWFELRGGECITGFDGAFATSFTVVPCELPHDAELVLATVLSLEPGAIFPGEDSALESAKETCDVSEALDRDAAALYSDLIVEFSYPTTQASWDAGYRGVYCFVTRSSGDFMAERLSG